MIEGLQFDFTAAQLDEHLAKKISYHQERVAFYERQAEALRSGGAQPMDYTGGDPVKALADKAKDHLRRTETFQIFRDHLVATETYRLKDEDLLRLDLVSRGW